MCLKSEDCFSCNHFENSDDRCPIIRAAIHRINVEKKRHAEKLAMLEVQDGRNMEQRRGSR